MTIQCPQCRQKMALKQEKLQQYSGKKIAMACPACGHRMGLKVRATNKTGPPPIPNADTTVVRTKAQHLQGQGSLHIRPSKNGADQVFPLIQSKTTVGRLSEKVGDPRPDCAIVTTDRYMSKVHCVVEQVVQGGEKIYLLRDNRSANGTFLNDKRLLETDQYFLTEGDEIRLGQTTVIFKIETS